ncbi:transposase [Actinosynnema sp. NPDC023587]|uniref:transposase n=1 Tax=Actinosynnema sp. NPDC023587 TaxID=3154695 RepID=UPI0033EAEB79
MPPNGSRRRCAQSPIRRDRGDGPGQALGPDRLPDPGVSESGLHAWRGRAPSARSVRHAWLTGPGRQVHTASNGVCGSRRVRAELMLGRGITVSHGVVEMLMKRAGITGLPGRTHRRPDRIPPPRPTWSTVVSSAPRRTGCGSPTSPSTALVRARSTARWCWTPSPAG